MNNSTPALLRTLLLMDTREGSPEIQKAIEFVADILSECGVRYEIVCPVKCAPSIVAHIPGKSGKSIVLCAHMDTADFDKTLWHVDPLGAVCLKGKMFGRGALDCKSLCAVWLSLLTQIANSKIVPKHGITLLITSDEESGGEWGAKWALNNTQLLNDVMLVLSEGGGYPVYQNSSLLYTVQCGERGRIKIQGEYDPPKISRQELMQQGVSAGFYSEKTVEYSKHAPGKARHIPLKEFDAVQCERDNKYTIIYKLPFLDNYKLEIDPSRIIESVECGKTNGAIKFLPTLQRALTKHMDAQLLPIITPGYSDNRHFRNAGIPVLGFFPLSIDNGIAGIHGNDEYITQQSLDLAEAVLSEIVNTLAFQ
ncbi:M20/M25/M40 family metallo-hydrolase [Eubacteriales bacterium OttesenSCG-928-K08]|nr:M20/M25/M40 family metallo-hydrolase [Eubacteriales bacterium OttesenSCG-928-K08]